MPCRVHGAGASKFHRPKTMCSKEKGSNKVRPCNKNRPCFQQQLEPSFDKPHFTCLSGAGPFKAVAVGCVMSVGAFLFIVNIVLYCIISVAVAIPSSTECGKSGTSTIRHLPDLPCGLQVQVWATSRCDKDSRSIGSLHSSPPPSGIFSPVSLLQPHTSFFSLFIETARFCKL